MNNNLNNGNFSYFSIFNRKPDNNVKKELTVVAWVKIAQQNTAALIFDSGKGATNGFFFQRTNDVLYSTAKTRSREVRADQNTGFQGLSGKWAHVAMTYEGNPLLIVKRANDVLYNTAKTRSRDVRTDQNTGFQGLSGKWAHVAMTCKGNPLLIVKRANDVLYNAAKTSRRDIRTDQNTGSQGLSGKWAHVAMT